jgi:hypothetical protein
MDRCRRVNAEPRIRLPRLLPVALLACWVSAWLAAGGCGPTVTGSLRAESLGQSPVILQTKYSAAVYGGATQAETSFCLSDIPLETLMSAKRADGQIVHIDLLWQPKAGQTPMDDDAVNTSIRYVIVSGEEVGVYGGGGFATVSGRVGKGRVTLAVHRASLRLLESTPAFTDLLGAAELTGRFTATLDDRTADQLRYAASQLVTNALGRSRYVDVMDCGEVPAVQPSLARLTSRD